MRAMMAAVAAAMMLTGCVAVPPPSGFLTPGVRPVGGGGDLAFTLTNATRYHLVQFFASPTTVASWEEDILGQSVLQPFQSVQVVIADGRMQCDYDLKMVFSDGDVLTDTVNLCQTGSYTIHE